MKTLILFSCAWLIAGCAFDRSSPRNPASPDVPQTSPQKRAVAAIMGDPTTLYANVSSGSGGVPGLDALQELVNAGLSLMTTDGSLIPQLAEQMPTIENGLWIVLPDGRMETTWRIRETARWHDGSPFVGDDLLFSGTLMRDPDLPNFQHTYFRSHLLESLEAPDARTLIAHWRQPFINASDIFTREVGYPIPKHLLEQTYLDEKAQLLALPHWSEQFVGTGPFKLRQFSRGSHVVLEANTDYVLGRPKIDLLEVRFIPDAGTLGANLLAGEVDVTIGRTISLEQGIQVRDQWRDGQMIVAPYALTRIYSQFHSPNPPALLNVQFRRALVHALDRQTMVDVLERGLTGVAHSVLPPGRPELRDVEAGVTRYDYDSRKAAELLDGLGFSRGSDGGFRDPAGARLGIEIRSTGGQDILEKPTLLAAEAWQRLGIAAEPLFVPPQRNQDREYRANRPGLLLAGGTSDIQLFGHLLSSEIPRPETNYVGRNDARYASAEYDDLYQSYVAAIPAGERSQRLRALVHHIAEALPLMGLYYRVEPTMVANRVLNVNPRQRNSMQVWNVHEWEVR